MSSRDASRGAGPAGGGAPTELAGVVRLRDARPERVEGAATPEVPPLVEAARRVADVTGAVLLTPAGARVGGGGYEDEVLGGEALFVGLLAAELGAALGAGELRSAVVEGSRRHLLLVASATHLLAVTARCDADAGAVDAALRAALPGAR